MQLRKVKAFELYNMSHPDPYNETMIFRSKEQAKIARGNYGGSIRQTWIYERA